MKESRPIYDEEHITRYITVMENYEEMKVLRERRLEVRELMEASRGDIERVNNIKQDITTKRAEEGLIKGEMKAIQELIESFESELQVVEGNLDVIMRYINTITNMRGKMVERVQTMERILQISESFQKKRQLEEDKVSAVSVLSKTDSHITHLTESRDTYIRKAEAFKELQAELALLEKKYERVVLLRKALSSSDDSIILVYIKLYMMDINTYINKVLKNVYGEGLEIGEFIIDEKGFRIPYTSNGVYVPDISMVSQGEETFVNLAFSSAFKRRSAGNYNVFVFDELDGPLDSNRRTAFVDSLDSELDELKAEQAFIISHNSVFESYDVDAILMGKTNTEVFNRLNVIHTV